MSLPLTNPFQNYFSRKVLVTQHTLTDEYDNILLDKVYLIVLSIITNQLTYIVCTNSTVHPFLVNVGIAMIGSLVIPSYQEIVLTSTLTGLCSTAVILNNWFVILLGVVIVAVFLIFKSLFEGVGGRLGLVAYLSSIVTCAIMYIFVKNYRFPKFSAEYYSLLDAFIYIFGPIYGGISCVLVYISYEYSSKSRNKLTVALAISYFAIQIFNVYYHELPETVPSMPKTYGGVFQYFVHFSPLAGTVSYSHLVGEGKTPKKGKIFLFHFFMIGFTCGWICIILFGLPNVGGKDGIIAFLGCYVYINLVKILRCIKKKISSFCEGEGKGKQNEITNDEKDKKENKV